MAAGQWRVLGQLRLGRNRDALRYTDVDAVKHSLLLGGRHHDPPAPLIVGVDSSMHATADCSFGEAEPPERLAGRGSVPPQNEVAAHSLPSRRMYACMAESNKQARGSMRNWKNR